MRHLDRGVLWLAQGLGSGRIAQAPGTWGSGVGLLWFALLLLPGRAPLWFAGCLLGAVAAVGLCQRAEQLLGRHDPGSVVLDEIVAVPVCFAVPVLAVWSGPLGRFPDLMEFLGAAPVWMVPAVFVAFRFFDIAKPWPVGVSQRLPGGWGIVADDLVAAGWVNLLAGLAWRLT